ncbi:MAG: hypothetical protein KKD94_06510, partial [Nanoarchaeota archaeon]|nr:hypothetical protein [Nanoarchaeota archaeon]
GAVYDENQTSFYMASEFIDVSCEPSWICGAWSECVNDARTRICLDAKNCGNNYEKPAEVDSCPDCVPNWTAHNTACNAITETYVIWYSDEEQCENVTVRGNDTVYCDPDGNGIIGKVHEIDDDNFDVIVYIDNDEINYSTNYTLLGEEKVEFVDEDTDLVRIEFDYDFEEEEALNLKIIHVEVQDDNDDFGYILIEGLEDIDKEVRVERILDSGIVCVEDRAIDDIDDIDEDCDGSREYIVQCPGENSNQDIECDVSSGVYIISGLEHSGVREIDGWTNPVCGSGHLNLCTTQTSCTNVGGYWYTNGCHSSQDCAASWTCNWGSCINGQRTKTCTDENNCESDTTETEACTAGCTPSWSCGAWDPLDDECSNEEEQTRTCTDLNNCGTLSGKPVETKSCEAGGLNLWLISLIAGISVLVIVIIVVLFKVLRNRSEDLVQEQPRIQVAQRQPRGFHQGMHYGGPGGPGSPGGGGAGGYRR